MHAVALLEGALQALERPAREGLAQPPRLLHGELGYPLRYRRPPSRRIAYANGLAHWYWMYTGAGLSASTSFGCISGCPAFVSLW